MSVTHHKSDLGRQSDEEKIESMLIARSRIFQKYFPSIIHRISNFNYMLILYLSNNISLSKIIRIYMKNVKTDTSVHVDKFTFVQVIELLKLKARVFF